MNSCPFCNPFSFDGQEIVLENEHCLFLQIPQDVLIGSGVIIPKLHKETVFDLSIEEWLATQNLLIEAKKLLDSKHSPEGYSVGWNCYEVGGQTIPHAHLHIIPRYKDEPYAGRGIRYWLKSEGNKRT
ncbi:HIT family protein [Peribacillus acanthi]|uniref:HIT family protein n=1 Tax=Peribacillus acanthi TaxID=2171554 RepID=UPI000D3ED069|nr:HIT family protein [Peribacillus acanthi]